MRGDKRELPVYLSRVPYPWADIALFNATLACTTSSGGIGIDDFSTASARDRLFHHGEHDNLLDVALWLNVCFIHNLFVF